MQFHTHHFSFLFFSPNTTSLGPCPVDQAWHRESSRGEPRHGGLCPHRNPHKVKKKTFFLSLKKSYPIFCFRLERGSLPDRFTNFFQSITFTNGGMRYHLINFRLSQVKLLLLISRKFHSSVRGKITALDF